MIIKDIKEIAERLSDKEYIEKISFEKDNFLNINGNIFYPYETASMSHGLPGACFLYNELSNIYPEEEKWMTYMNEYLQLIIRNIQEHGLNDLSSFSGLSGIATLVNACSKNGRYYSKFKSSIDMHIKEMIKIVLPTVTRSEVLSIYSYDAIQGLSGVLNYLILNKSNIEYFQDEIGKILDFFIGLSTYKIIDGKKVSNWHIEPEELFLEEERVAYPNGVINLGLSHGISGPLVAMSSSFQKGIVREGLSEAIQHISNILIDSKNNESYSWPGMIAIDNLPNKTNYKYRDAWCYGRPGVAFALLKSGIALNEERYYRLANEAMKSEINNENGVISPTFCHGYSGLAYIYYKFYKLTEEKDYFEEAKRLIKKVINFYDVSSPFGFQNIEYDQNNIKKINSIGLLDGISTVYLVLLSIMNDEEGRWESLFLLN